MTKINKSDVENIATTKLLDLIHELDESARIEDEDEDIDWDYYGELTAELDKRYPFNQILGAREEQNETTLKEDVENLEEDVKFLKRHKHDSNSGDVLIRI